MKLSAVIVNYNDYNNTVRLVNQLLKYDTISYVVVVDNASTNHNGDVLASIKNDKFHFIQNNDNKGYGAGNNIGILQSKQVLDCTHALIVNPDVEISEEVIEVLIDSFFGKKDALIIAPSTFFNGKRVAWNVKCFSDLILSKLIIASRVSQVLKEHMYSNEYFEDKSIAEVDAVLGACLMVDIEKFERIGMYDDCMFLYEEEDYLAIRSKQFNYKTYLLCNECYIHNHKNDNDRSLAEQLWSKKQMCKSLLYLTKQYYKFGFFKQTLANFLLAISILEVRVSYYIRNIIRR